MNPKQPFVADNESFILLMRVAREDAGVRRHLLTILSQTPFNRTSMLNTFINEMRLRKAPAEIISAVACLLDHEVALQAVEMLTGSAHNEKL